MTERFPKQNKNAGFSLLELIVTVIILAILSGSAIIGVSQILRTNVSTSADKVVAALNQARYENMYLEGNITIKIVYENEHYYVVTCLEKEEGVTPVTEERQREEIGDNKIQISAVNSAGTTVDIRTTPITIAFYKSSGALKSVGGIYRTICIENASKKAEISLVEHTGRCFTEVE